MRGRRRTIALFFATILAGLTTISSARAVQPRPVTLRDSSGDGIAMLAAATSRPAVIVAHVAAGRPALANGSPAALQTVTAETRPPATRQSLALHRRAYGTQDPASAYDATAPPRSR